MIAIVIALLTFAALIHAFRTAKHPAIEPTPPPKPPGIFSEVGGWIAYGNRWGIWAVDTSHPSDRESRLRLSSVGGTPLAWSGDGSKLLIARDPWVLLPRRDLIHGAEVPASRLGLFVLNADGTETHLVRDEVSGASFSPDGTTVVFAPSLEVVRNHLDPGIYAVDTDGGVPRLLVEPSRRVHFPGQDRSFLTGLYFPAFSPDGMRIAYFDGLGDSSHSLRVVNAEGNDLHVLIDNIDAYRITNLVWSPDGTTLAFGRRSPDAVYTIGVDGSGLRLVIPNGVNPYWSPDGSRLSFGYNNLNRLSIADADGTRVQNEGYGTSGPWNPLVQPEPEVAEVPSTSGRLPLTSTLLLAVLLLAIVTGVVALFRRRQVHRS